MNSPINRLNLSDFLRLLHFLAAIHSGIPDYSGIAITRYKSNAEIHRALIIAFKMFDNWETDYFQMIKEWKTQDKKYFVNCKEVYLSRIELSRENSEYELFNQILNNQFYEAQFDFLHIKFKEFLNGVS
jgi:hypothetical protein